MKRLLTQGYKPARRPSHHVISDGFSKDNGGAIPPNLLSVSNTRSNEAYLRGCKAEGLTPHPARFPRELPDFFIRFLTEPGDLVVDPFAGSNITGSVAEDLGRRWLVSELREDYLRGSRHRFPDLAPSTVSSQAA
jgi:site-specific DNA-methyltransferase (cytosine-N4-specific)